MTRNERRDAGRHMKKHGLVRKEEGRSIGRTIVEKLKERHRKVKAAREFKKSPAGQRQEVQRLRLEAQKEAAKTSIVASKKKRRDLQFGGLGTTPQPRSTGSRRKRQTQSQQSGNIFAVDNFGDSSSGQGLNDLFGGGLGQQPKPKRTSKPTKQFSGMDDLF